MKVKKDVRGNEESVFVCGIQTIQPIHFTFVTRNHFVIISFITPGMHDKHDTHYQFGKSNRYAGFLECTMLLLRLFEGFV